MKIGTRFRKRVLIVQKRPANPCESILNAARLRRLAGGQGIAPPRW